ncbi:MAG: hypothetical protein AB7F35_18355 [Acetobacteraceae bacterium]
MSVAGAVTNGLYAALLLARGRPEGMQLVETNMDGAVRSFWALPLSIPAIVGVRLIAWAEAGIPANGAQILIRDLMIYGVSWLAFAVLSHRLAGAVERGIAWPQFIATWNWCTVVGNTMVMVAGLPGLLGAPPIVDQAMELIAVGWALWLEWYATRLSLHAGPMLAAYFVMVDQLVGLAFAIAGAPPGAG